MSDDENVEKNNNGWNSWKIYVIKSLEKLEKRQSDLEKEVHDYQIENNNNVTELQTKSRTSATIISMVVALIIGIIVNVGSAFLITNYIDSKYDNNPKSQKVVEEVKNNSTGE